MKSYAEVGGDDFFSGRIFGMKGMIDAATFKDMYDVDASPTLISKVTDSVMEEETRMELDRFAENWD